MPDGLLYVEGESDRIALMTLAARRGVQVADGRIVSMGGVTNLGRHLSERAPGTGFAVLHDANETPYVDRTLHRFGVDPPCFVCDRDLEDELVRALGRTRTFEVIEAAGDLPKWHTLTEQPFHRDRPEPDVLRRFFTTTSGRKAKYAALLVSALEADRTPAPLAGALAEVTLGSHAPAAGDSRSCPRS